MVVTIRASRWSTSFARSRASTITARHIGGGMLSGSRPSMSVADRAPAQLNGQTGRGPRGSPCGNGCDVEQTECGRGQFARLDRESSVFTSYLRPGSPGRTATGIACQQC